MDIAAILLAVLVFLVLTGSIERKIDRVDRRTARIERKLDRVIEHLGVADDELGPDLDAIRALVRDGKKVEAVKEYRKATGMGLREAVAEVDRIEAGTR